MVKVLSFPERKRCGGEMHISFIFPPEIRIGFHGLGYLFSREPETNRRIIPVEPRVNHRVKFEAKAMPRRPFQNLLRECFYSAHLMPILPKGIGFKQHRQPILGQHLEIAHNADEGTINLGYPLVNTLGNSVKGYVNRTGRRRHQVINYLLVE